MSDNAEVAIRAAAMVRILALLASDREPELMLKRISEVARKLQIELAATAAEQERAKGDVRRLAKESNGNRGSPALGTFDAI
jgi:hypothetical protein